MTFSFPTVAHKNEQQDIIVYHNMDSNAQNSQVNEMKDVIDISFYIDTPLDIAMAGRFIRNPLHTIDEVLFECEVYLQAGREAYLEMEKSVKPNVDYVIDGEMAVEHIVEAIMNKL